MARPFPLWLTTALDVVAQHRSTGEPLQALVPKLARARGLGSRDRQLVGDAAFGWSRLPSKDLGAHVKKRDADGLQMLAALRDRAEVVTLLAELSPQLMAVVEQWPSAGEKSKWPDWFAEALAREYKDKAEALLAALNERAPLILAVDRRFMSVDEAAAALLKRKIETRRSTVAPQALVVTSEGFTYSRLPAPLRQYLWLMDEGSQHVAEQVASAPGDLVLDMCAGGGGKTRYLLQSGASVVAMDVSESRLHASLEREGVSEAFHLVADGGSPPFKPASFDWILIDAPCSGTGTLRRAPDALARVKETDISGFVQIQRRLVEAALPLLKPQGRLVYATCSILPDENRLLIEESARDLPIQILSAQQLLPSEDGCDGFFAASIALINN